MRLSSCVLPCLVLVLLAGCATHLDRDGRPQTRVDIKYLAKTEVDRIADAAREEVVGGLLLIADKLYKRNPREWRKAGLASHDAAVDKLRQRIRMNWPEMQGQRERTAAALAFAEDYRGDRVAALMFGLLTMVDAAFEHKEEFFMLDSLNEQKLMHTARNLEIAIWKLGNNRMANGELFLLSNELDPAQRNLSFEREFGRQIGLLDFMARVIADRNGRTLSRVTQSVATSFFLPVSF